MQPRVCGWFIKLMPWGSLNLYSVLSRGGLQILLWAFYQSKQRGNIINKSIYRKEKQYWEQRETSVGSNKEDMSYSKTFSTSLHEMQWWVSRAASYEVPSCRQKHCLIKTFDEQSGVRDLESAIKINNSLVVRGLLLPIDSSLTGGVLKLLQRSLIKGLVSPLLCSILGYPELSSKIKPLKMENNLQGTVDIVKLC